MRIGQPGVHRPHGQLDGEGGEKGEEQPRLHGRREFDRCKDLGDVGGARLPVHGHDGQQHQHRPKQGEEEELERGIHPALAAPHPDDQEHGDEAAFEEQVEDHQIERAEHADHQRLEHQEGDHILLHPLLDAPACDDADGHQEGGQDDEQHGDAVDAHAVVHHPTQPDKGLVELEAGIGRVEVRPDKQRHQEGDDGGRQRRPAHVAHGDGVIAADDQDEQRPHQRQEGGDGKYRPAGHQCAPPNMYQVMRAATPISMAKA